MSKTKTSYAELERAVRLDLAARTISDPDADPTHVDSARKVLEHDSHELTLDDVSQLHMTTRSALIAILSGDPARRERVVAAALQSADDWDAYQRGLADAAALRSPS
jgi:hypothetical protein